MTSLHQHNSTKFWPAKYCMFRFDVEKWEPRKAIMFCQPKRVLLVNMLYTVSDFFNGRLQMPLNVAYISANNIKKLSVEQTSSQILS